MTLASGFTLLVTMMVLALIPGPGILVVVANTLGCGMKRGVITSLGIVTGDYVFIVLSLLGLVALAEVMGPLFVLVKYAGAAYLFWLAWQALRNTGSAGTAAHERGFLAAYLSGAVTTLSNPKAILFYLSLFPALLDVQALSVPDVMLVFVITTVAVFGVMVGYAWMAHQSRHLLINKRFERALRYGSAALLSGSGLYVALRQTT